MDALNKLEILIDHEYKKQQKRMRDYERAYERIVVLLEDVKGDEDVEDYMNQLKKNIAYDSMRRVGNVLYEVQEFNKKRKVEQTE